MLSLSKHVLHPHTYMATPAVTSYLFPCYARSCQRCSSGCLAIASWPGAACTPAGGPWPEHLRGRGV